MVPTDTKAATRGEKSYAAPALIAKGWGVLPGFKDPQLLRGELKRNTPTMTVEAAAKFLHIAASHEDV